MTTEQPKIYKETPAEKKARKERGEKNLASMKRIPMDALFTHPKFQVGMLSEMTAEDVWKGWLIFTFKQYGDGHDRVAGIRDDLEEYLNEDVIDGGDEMYRKIGECAEIEDEDEFVKKAYEILLPALELRSEFPEKSKKR